jgi:organic hydroperoxide reductase OsmC/OhrA
MAITGEHDYVVRAATTGTFGRVLLSARTNHLVVDGPAQNGCPGEATTPAELFLGGIASCAAELVQVLARDQAPGLSAVNAEIAGTVDRAHELRSDVTVFSAVALHFTLEGVDDAQARDLVEQFKGR